MESLKLKPSVVKMEGLSMCWVPLLVHHLGQDYARCIGENLSENLELTKGKPEGNSCLLEVEVG